MKRDIESFIRNLKSNKKLESFDEASTKQAVVLRLLSFLGWDIFNVDEVLPNYSVNSHSVDYALRLKNTTKVFIDVKRVQEKLDNYQKQLLHSSVQDNAEISVLTNGVVWWFYLPLVKGNLQQKRFSAIHLLQDSIRQTSPKLIDFLSKSKIAKGEALKSAKTIHHTKRQKIAADIIPEAWNKILSEPNKIFVELLSESTEKLCGFKIESELIEKFLKQNESKWLLKSANHSQSGDAGETVEPLILQDEIPAPPTRKKPVPATKKIVSYADKEIHSFSFNGQTYKVNHWEDILTSLGEYFATIHAKDFERVLWISGEKSTYFSRYKDQLGIPEKIKGTDIYVETKLSPDEVVKTARDLLAEFGYDWEEVDIKTH